MNRQELITRLVARKLQTAASSKNLFSTGKIICTCLIYCRGAVPRQQTSVANPKN